MDPVIILNLILAICLAAERIYRRFERHLDPPQPTAHLEMPPPVVPAISPSRRQLTINIPPK